MSLKGALMLPLLLEARLFSTFLFVADYVVFIVHTGHKTAYEK